MLNNLFKGMNLVLNPHHLWANLTKHRIEQITPIHFLCLKIEARKLMPQGKPA